MIKNQHLVLMAALAIGACEGSGGGGSPTGVPDLPYNVTVATIEITPRSGSRRVGETLQFIATALDGDGNVLVGRAVTWEAMNPSVAGISESGLVRGRAVGTSAIRASVGDVSGFARFDVEEVSRKSDKPGRFER